MKYLTKYVQHSCAENRRTLIKEMKDVRKERAIPCAWIERFSTDVTSPQFDL